MCCCQILLATSNCKIFLGKTTRLEFESEAGLGKLFPLGDFPGEVSFVNPRAVQCICRCIYWAAAVQYILVLLQKRKSRVEKHVIN